MAHLVYRNVNQAFRDLVRRFSLFGENHTLPMIKTSSRAGNVIQVIEPMTITYTQPRERVLFNQARDANPFFHLFEALWMLAGKNDVPTMAYYNSGIAGVASDNGLTFNGAYGYRWRQALGAMEHRSYDGNGYLSPHVVRPHVDQLRTIIDQLKHKPDSRRVVLQMWNVEDDLLKIDSTKDVCCNTHAYFMINQGCLDMTVCNRSNDLIWGMLGANVVHFSILQQYIADQVGVPVGVYNQFTNNLHVYTERFKPTEWLDDMVPDYYTKGKVKITNAAFTGDTFLKEVELIVEEWMGKSLENVIMTHRPKNYWLCHTVMPMLFAFEHHKHRRYNNALSLAGEIESDDWRIASTNWLQRRKAHYEQKLESGNPYLENELERQGVKTSPDES